MRDAQDRSTQDQRTAVGLTGGAALSILLAAATDSHWLVVPAIGMLISAVILAYRTLKDQPGGSWIAWAAGTVISLLLVWTNPDDRVLQIPVTGVLAVGATALFLRWRAQHR
ncbi:hypothetical protein [Kitasatospora kifunensis]|uniref:Integral membrane protein n=1 Tax=Kitasatospora kifunensis TaxID=58351 RepID=A0A7W7RBR8_KITKI|nr:hypothetical protein [Kitasatospora kifunensis]MBB4929076.1 hypothetical protein [Kitasatospora kifunensis]